MVTHVAIDIETNSVKMNCGIWEVGLASTTDNNPHSPSGREWRCAVPQCSYPATQDTLDFLDEQGRLADYHAALASMLSLSHMLSQLASDIREIRTRAGDGPVIFWQWRSFDYPRLEYWFNYYNIDIPWMFYEVRDLASIHAYAPGDIPRPDTSTHRALNDAKETLRCAVQTHKFLEGLTA